MLLFVWGALAKRFFNLFNDLFEPLRIARVAFPHRLNPPAKRFELGNMALIARYVRRKLGGPIVAARLWMRGEPASGMLVPKAAMDKNRELVFREDDVRLARELPAMKPEPKPKRMKSSPHSDFGLCPR